MVPSVNLFLYCTIHGHDLNSEPRKRHLHSTTFLSAGKSPFSFFSTVILYCSRIHERTISLRFLGIILRVLRIEVSVWIS
jgi:hypothetical protein